MASSLTAAQQLGCRPSSQKLKGRGFECRQVLIENYQAFMSTLNMSFLNGMILAEWVDGSGKNGSLISINTVEIKKWNYIAWQSSDLRNLTRLGVQDIF